MTAIERIVIVGDGVDGWSAAAALACAFGTSRTITVVPYPVAELPALSLRPAFRRWIGILGIEEQAIRRPGCVTLSHAFHDWPGAEPRYVLPAGGIGVTVGDVAFHHLWLALRARGTIPPLEDFAIGAVAADAGRFAPPARDPSSPLSGLDYGYHLDTAAYRDMLHDYAVRRGVQVAPAAARATTRAERIVAVSLVDGRAIAGDLFLDATGPARLLIGATLAEPVDDRGGWMADDRALAWSTPPQAVTTRTQTRHAGRATIQSLPLPDRTVHILRHRATDTIDDAAPPDATPIALATGRPARSWVENCVAIGAAAAGTADHDGAIGALLQKGVTQLVQLFPARTGSRIEAIEYNRRMRRLQDQFAAAAIFREHMARRHYGDTATATVPEALAERMTLFARTGRLPPSEDDPIHDTTWAAMMLGHRVIPHAIHPFATLALDARTVAALLSIPERLRHAVASLPRVSAA